MAGQVKLLKNKCLSAMVILGTVLMAHPGYSAELKGVRFEDEVKLGEQRLVLNGVGLRTATILSVKVYVAGLYLPKKAKDTSEVLKIQGPKQLTMQFMREIDAKTMHEAYDVSFEKNCEVNCKADMAYLSKLKQLVPGVKEGDRLTYTFKEKGVEVAHNGKVKGEIPSKTFADSLLLTWIGKKPPTDDLKNGLLGLEG